LNPQWPVTDVQVGHSTRGPLPSVSHRAFAGMAVGDVLKNPLEGARYQNIENNPMQSSRRPSMDASNAS
jgi:hypothetical protein